MWDFFCNFVASIVRVCSYALIHSREHERKRQQIKTSNNTKTTN